MTRPSPRQRQASGTVGRRQHGDPPAYPERGRPGAGRCGAGAGRRRRRGVGLQLPVRWVSSRVRGLLHELSPRRSGWGGTVDHDGNSVQCVNNGNCRNTPVEILETKYPFIVEEYRLRPTRRVRAAGGGLATSRIFRVNAPEITVNALFDRTRTHGPGIFGGQVGASSGIFIQRPATTGSVASRRRSARSPIPSSRASR